MFLKFSGSGIALAGAMLLHRYASLIAAIVSLRRCCAARTAASYASRVAIVVSRRLRYLYCALPTYSCCRSRLPYCGILCYRRRNHAASLCAADPPSRPRCSLRSSRRYDDYFSERRLCHTAPSRYVLPLRFSTTACRLRCRCVIHAIRRATDLLRRPRIAPLTQLTH